MRGRHRYSITGCLRNLMTYSAGSKSDRRPSRSNGRFSINLRVRGPT